MSYRDGSKQCPDCGRRCDRRAQRCKPCSGLAMRGPTNTCALCGTNIRRSSTHCYRCIGCLRGLSTEERFMERVVTTESGCWEWTGWRAHGYGYFFHEGKDQRAHRVSYELFVGSIPDGLVVMHSCDNRPCVNPDHLSVGTQADNVRDMVAKGRQRNRVAARMCGLA